LGPLKQKSQGAQAPPPVPTPMDGGKEVREVWDEIDANAAVAGLQENDFRSTFDESTRIERQYKQYFDEMIVNDNMDETYNKLRRAIEKLSTKHQWVPVNWVY